jgi:two-component sensor histidine kinase
MVTQLPHQDRSTTQSRPNEPVASLVNGVTNLLSEMELRHQNHYEVRIHEIERLIDAKLTTLRTIIDLQAEKSVNLLAASDKAISKAEAATEKRFESVNEFRLTLSDQTKSFISKVEFEALRDTTGTRISGLSSRLDKIEGKAVGLTAGWIYLLGGLSAVGTVVSVFVAIFLRSG